MNIYAHCLNEAKIETANLMNKIYFFLTFGRIFGRIAKSARICVFQFALKSLQKRKKDPKALTFRSKILVENSRLELLTSRV